MARNGVPSVVLFLDAPPGGNPSATLGKWAGHTRPCLLIQECEVVVPRNWDRKNHRHFAAVFTWSSELLHDQFYSRVHFAQVIQAPVVDGWKDRPHFCCLIAGNKRSNHPLELYSHRIKAVRWFERHHPDRFHLYGINWDRAVIPGPRWLRGAIVRTPIARWLAPHFPSYKGPVANKHACLKQHRFSICFENAREISGYVTEKIFDCMMAGCVPVYWGASDITDHVPASCFIDFRQFSHIEEMYRFIDEMPETKFIAYQKAIRAFLLSEEASRFSIGEFSQVIAERLSSIAGHSPSGMEG
jgi:alpha(1,3/1,4) fucosyltransferase